MEPLLLSCIESRVENSRNFYGRFQLGPFVLGQGLTIANSLRRSLLSEISGLAITAVEIEGVVHEYSTIEGVRESVLDILLNVKQIILTSDFQIQEPQVAFLQIQGPGIVRAKDIKLPISIQSVDPEQYIATLLYDGLLKMKFMICRGKNYLVQTPLGLKIPNSPLVPTPDTLKGARSGVDKSSKKMSAEQTSYRKQEEPYDTMTSLPEICFYPTDQQEERVKELKAEVFLTKSLRNLKQNTNYNPSLSKKSTESSFASFLQIENLQDPNILTSPSNILTSPSNILTSPSNILTSPSNITEGDVKMLEGDVKMLEGDVKMLEGDVKMLEGDVKMLEGDVRMLSKEEENNAAFTSHKSRVEMTSTKEMLEVLGSNNDVTIDLSNNIQNEKKNFPVYSTNSEESLLNNNRAELSSLPNSEKKNTIDSKVDITDFSFLDPERVLDVGDVRREQKEELKKTSNILPIDAVFMPINRVNFTIEPNNKSVAPKDLVILEIWTNGSIHPKQAINEAAKALIQLIAPFQEVYFFKSVFINSPKVLQRSLSSSSSALTNFGLPARTKKKLRLSPHLDITALDAKQDTPFRNVRSNTSLEKIKTPLVNIPERNVRSKEEDPSIVKMFAKTEEDILGQKTDLTAGAKQTTFLHPERDCSAQDIRGSKKVAKQESPLIYGGKHRNLSLNKKRASLDIGNLNLSLRPYTCLKRAKIETVADLLQYSAEDLLNLKNFGKRSLDEIEQNLNQIGLNLRS